MKLPRPPHVTRNPVSLLGGILAITGLGALAFFLAIQFLGEGSGHYLGVVIYMGLPALLVFGLLLIPVGALWEGRRRAVAARQGRGVPPAMVLDFGNARHLLGVLGFAATTVVILGVLGATGYRAIEFMDSPSFCETCHDVMEPQIEAYKRSEHAEIACTACHIGPEAGPIGPGASRYVEAKIGGLRQTYLVLTRAFSRPVHAEPERIPETSETCQRCHAPGRDYGLSVRVYRTFLPDETNSPHVRVLAFQTGRGASENQEGAGIHWHTTANLLYRAADADRQVIAWVGLETDEGLKEWVNPEVSAYERRNEPIRMDCIACHNRTGHRIPSPGELVDEALATGRLASDLPYLKREALRLLGVGEVLPDLDGLTAWWLQDGWFEQLEDFYRENYPDIATSRGAAIRAAVDELKRISKEVLYPDMRAAWFTYPDNLGHPVFDWGNPGCFRCHGTLVNVETGERLKGTVGGEGCLGCHELDWQEGTRLEEAELPGADRCTLCHVGIPLEEVEGLAPDLRLGP